jgi:putative phosphoribosyl transferase
MMYERVSTRLTRFLDRADAGRQLAAKLVAYVNRPEVLVLGLPRGGIPVAAEVARSLHAPLDVCLVRKLGVPGHSELAMGAIASDGVPVLNNDVINWLEISDQTMRVVTAQELRELRRRDRAYRGNRPPPTISDRIIILVDDGIATSATMRAAISVIKPQHPAKLVIAVPVAPQEVCQQLPAEVDELVCLMMPEPFYAIGLWYEDFSQLTDAEVRALLHQ